MTTEPEVIEQTEAQKEEVEDGSSEPQKTVDSKDTESKDIPVQKEEPEENKDTTEGKQSPEATEAQQEETEGKKEDEEEIDLDLNDPELAQAALKIQSGFRGHLARKEIDGMKVCCV